MPLTSDKLQEFVNDVIEEVAAPDTRPIQCNININNQDGQIATNGGVNKKHVHPAWIMSIMSLVFVGFYLLSPVSVAQSTEFADDIRLVAKCEGLNPTSVHNEMKNKYDYAKYKNMSRLDYYLATWSLSSRKCTA